MSVTEGSGDREFTANVRHVTNGDPGNQNTFRAATTDLEKRTDALKDFVNSLETFVHDLLGTDSASISGVQGVFNSTHTHNGTGDVLLDNQQIYNNGDDNAVVNLATNGSYTINMASGTNVVINASDATPLFRIDNDTKKVFIGALQTQFD